MKFNVRPRDTVCAFLNVAVWGLWHIYGGTKCELHYTIWTAPFSISVRVRVVMIYIIELDPSLYVYVPSALFGCARTPIAPAI